MKAARQRVPRVVAGSCVAIHRLEPTRLLLELVLAREDAAIRGVRWVTRGWAAPGRGGGCGNGSGVVEML